MNIVAIGFCVCGLLIFIAIVVCMAHADGARKKPNVRVPRETLWARTNKYFGDPE